MAAGNETKHATRPQKHEQPAGKAIENTVRCDKIFMSLSQYKANGRGIIEVPLYSTRV
jgi:hypothetical protein